MTVPRRRPGLLKRSTLSLLSLRAGAEKASANLPALMLAAEKAATSIRTGDHRQRKSGSGEKFWQFREYMPGDRPQDIDWRQSARGDRLFVRQKEWQTAQTALFWLQRDAGMDYASRHNLPSKKDAAATIALGLSMLVTQAGELAGLADGSLRPGRSEQALELLGEKFLEHDDRALPAYIEPQRNTSLILAGDFLSPLTAIAPCFEQLAARTANATVIQVLDPAEINLPFSGRVIFESPQNADERHHVTNVHSIRETYQKRIEEHIDGMKHLCRRCGWNWILHITDKDVRDTLFAAWMSLGEPGFHGAPAAGDRPS